ncbi:MAG: hypothetical protein AAF125_04255, partial [Chloroflexota bacterium]
MTTAFPKPDETRIRQQLAEPAGKIRLIIDTDAHNEIDDQYAIAWALMSQDVFEIEGVLAEPYSHRHHREPTIQAYDTLKADPNAKLPAKMERYHIRATRMLASGIDPRQINYVDPDEGMELSYQEILKVFELMGEDPAGRVHRGAADYMTSLDAPIGCDAVDCIIE